MRTLLTQAATLIAAALILATTATTASAGRLSTSEQSIRVSWASLEFGSELVTVRCRLTLEGSFHSRTIAKVARALIGAITRAIVAHRCTNGEMWADNGTEPEPLGAPNRLPFHLTYESFAGTLPNISSLGLLLSRVSFVIATSGTMGRYGNATDNVSYTATRTVGGATNGAITRITPVVGRDRLTLVTCLEEVLFTCPARLVFAGSSGPVTGLTNTNTISISLI